MAHSTASAPELVKKQLSAKHIDLLSQWVKDGAPWDADALLDPPDIPRAVTLGTLPVTYHPVLALAHVLRAAVHRRLVGARRFEPHEGLDGLHGVLGAFFAVVKQLRHIVGTRGLVTGRLLRDQAIAAGRL